LIFTSSGEVLGEDRKLTGNSGKKHAVATVTVIFVCLGKAECEGGRKEGIYSELGCGQLKLS